MMDVILIIVIVLIIGIALRDGFCWYVKIDQRIKLLEKQVDQSKETNRLLTQLIQETKINRTGNDG